MNRTQAPMRTVERQGVELPMHPDWFWSLSGGVDSTAALIHTRDALDTSRTDGQGPIGRYSETPIAGNYSKKPLAVYFDTGIGIPLNRLYAEQLCDYFGVQLWTLRTEESFLHWLQRDGAPGSGAHPEVRNELKGRQSSKLTSLSDYPHFVLGIAADESDDRADRRKVEPVYRKDTGALHHVEVYPAHRLSRKERAEIILRSEVPINPLWLYPDVTKDCACLCHGDPSQLDAIREAFPEFGQRMAEWEEAIDHDGLEGTLGWSGLSAREKRVVEAGHEQLSLTTCGIEVDCQRSRDPTEVRAFGAKADGATPDEAVSILYDDAPGRAVA